VPQQPAAATPDTTDDEAARHEAEQVQAPAVAAPDTEIAPTHTITNWTLGKLIGQGAFGAVYQVRLGCCRQSDINQCCSPRSLLPKSMC
jgi:hypothetical protein